MTELSIVEHGATTVASLYDEPTGSFQYVLTDTVTKQAVIIDPVLNFDPNAGAVSTASADMLLAHVRANNLTVAWVLDTHPHADHFSAAPYLGDALGAPRAIGDKVIGVQKLWRDIYCLEGFSADGSQWDRLLADGESLKVGNTEVRVMFSPGHTLASISYVTDDVAFVHDTLMMPDSGTSRADFPGGDSAALYRSVRRILDLHGQTALYVGHDYGKDGRDPACVATVAEHRADNIHVHDGVDEAEFVRLRDARDATLPLPKLMLAALQVNIRGGRLPPVEACGRAFLRIPLDYFAPPSADNDR